jgi:hypothetical protein
MYAWTLVGHRLSEAELLSGCNDNRAEVMRRMEPHLLSYRAFACRIVEVVPCISVADLAVEFQPTGRTWLGRRTTTNSVRWIESFDPAVPADPRGSGPRRFAPLPLHA